MLDVISEDKEKKVYLNKHSLFTFEIQNCCFKYIYLNILIFNYIIYYILIQMQWKIQSY